MRVNKDTKDRKPDLAEMSIGSLLASLKPGQLTALLAALSALLAIAWGFGAWTERVLSARNAQSGSIDRGKDVQTPRGRSLARQIARYGLTDIEDRDDPENLAPPPSVFRGARIEVLMTCVSCRRALDPDAKEIVGLLDRGIDVYMIVLNPASQEAAILLSKDRRSIQGDILQSYCLVERQQLLTRKNFHFGTYEQLPPYIGIMIDGDVAPRGAKPNASHSVVRIQPRTFARSHYEGPVFQFDKERAESHAIIDFFEEDFRAQWAGSKALRSEDVNGACANLERNQLTSKTPGDG
jgi:hypothetical protein